MVSARTGLLNQLTKNVLETALDAEMTEHLGYDRHDPPGRGSGNSRNGGGPRRCSPRSARSRSTCRAIRTARSSRRSANLRQPRLTGIDKDRIVANGKGIDDR